MLEQMYHQMLNSLQEGIYFVDKERTITFWNQGAERITGFTRQEVIGLKCFDNILNHVDEEGNHLCFGGCPLHLTLQDQQERLSYVFLHHKNGYRVPVQVKIMPIYDDLGAMVGAAEMFVDESHVFGKDLTFEELQSIAYTDQLTQIPNRRASENYLRQAHQGFLDNGIPYAFVMIDIDHFKNVNDTYGHDFGDEVLKMIAQTLAHATRTVDFTGRWGGEEFMMAFVGISKENLHKLLEKIRMLVNTSAYRDKKTAIRVTVSIGASCVQEDDTPATVIKRADEQLYFAKQNGRNRVEIC